METTVIYKVIAESGNINLCGRCNGKGWKWSNLDFGDIPGDEKKICCEPCSGTGRIKTVRVEADIVVPFDWELK